MHRRQFFGLLGASIGTSFAATRLGAQEETRNTTGNMDQDAYRPVKLPAKVGVAPHVTDTQRDDLEHHLHCQCGCGLDVYTCRTTDFSCSVSPAMHFDVMGLVAGGYGLDEIMAAFRTVYGERVLMEPVREGFNWLAYILPFAALATGAGVVVFLLKSWTRPKNTVAPAVATTDATPDELERLRNALRSDE